MGESVTRLYSSGRCKCEAKWQVTEPQVVAARVTTATYRRHNGTGPLMIGDTSYQARGSPQRQVPVLVHVDNAS
jgi:hypothetical protein